MEDVSGGAGEAVESGAGGAALGGGVTAGRGEEGRDVSL